MSRKAGSVSSMSASEIESEIYSRAYAWDWAIKHLAASKEPLSQVYCANKLLTLGLFIGALHKLGISACQLSANHTI